MTVIEPTESHPAPLRQYLPKAITPLRLVFWGGLLCILDFTVSSTVNGRGFKFDILNDALGMILITVGVFKLGAIPVHRQYHNAMTFVKVMAVIGIVQAVMDHFVLPMPAAIGFLSSLLSLASLAAIVTFCVAMMWFCLEAGLPDVARSWKVTLILFVAIYLIPLGPFNLIAMGALLTGKSFHINLGPLAILLILVFLVPIVHLFISTSRMKRAAERN
ncbi:MAG TPA: hypothetical protein VM389_03815 [Phycisphaerae bacterium]|nr:hypothetical protein [Phycisphaerae bacterium]